MNPKTTGRLPSGWQTAGLTSCGARIWIPSGNGQALPDAKAGLAPDILYFNDTHGGIDRLLPALKRAIDPRRQVNAEWLTVSGGDDHGGGSRWDAGFFTGARQSMAYSLLERGQVDICVPGNHDLDWGWEAYAERCRLSPGVIRVLTNLRPGMGLLADHHQCLLVEFKNHLMAVTGALCTDQTREAHRYLTDPADCLPALANALRPHVDSVLVISHLGYHSRTGQYADQALLADTPDSVLVAGAHTHDVIPSTGAWHAGRYLQCGQKGRFLGFVKCENANWRIRVEGVSGSVAGMADDLEADLEASCDAAGSICFPDDRTTTEQPSRDGYRGECATINAVTDQILKREPEAAGLVAALCVRFFGARPVAGRMTLRDWIECFPYGDCLCLMQVPVARLPDLLAANARRLSMPAHYLESRGMLHFSGNLTYRVSGSGKSLHVTDIRLAGEAISDHAGKASELQLLTQAYVAEGMGGYATVFKEANLNWSREVIDHLGVPIRETLWESFVGMDDEARSASLVKDKRLVYDASGINADGSGSSGSTH